MLINNCFTLGLGYQKYIFGNKIMCDNSSNQKQFQKKILLYLDIVPDKMFLEIH